MLEADITVVWILGAEKNGKNIYSKIKPKSSTTCYVMIDRLAKHPIKCTDEQNV